MKTFITLLSILVLSLSLSAAETAPKKKSPAKPKAPAAEEAKPSSAKIEAIAKTLTASQRTKLLTLLNEGDDKALINLPGIGETRAAAIKKARPFADVTDVMKVEGVGDNTFAEMVANAKAGFPSKNEVKKEEAAEKKAPPAKKKETPKKKDSKGAK